MVFPLMSSIVIIQVASNEYSSAAGPVAVLFLYIAGFVVVAIVVHWKPTIVHL